MVTPSEYLSVMWHTWRLLTSIFHITWSNKHVSDNSNKVNSPLFTLCHVPLGYSTFPEFHTFLDMSLRHCLNMNGDSVIEIFCIWQVSSNRHKDYIYKDHSKGFKPLPERRVIAEHFCWGNTHY